MGFFEMVSSVRARVAERKAAREAMHKQLQQAQEAAREGIVGAMARHRGAFKDVEACVAASSTLMDSSACKVCAHAATGDVPQQTQPTSQRAPSGEKQAPQQVAGHGAPEAGGQEPGAGTPSQPQPHPHPPPAAQPPAATTGVNTHTPQVFVFGQQGQHLSAGMGASVQPAPLPQQLHHSHQPALGAGPNMGPMLSTNSHQGQQAGAGQGFGFAPQPAFAGAQVMFGQGPAAVHTAPCLPGVSAFGQPQRAQHIPAMQPQAHQPHPGVWGAPNAAVRQFGEQHAAQSRAEDDRKHLRLRAQGFLQQQRNLEHELQKLHAELMTAAQTAANFQAECIRLEAAYASLEAQANQFTFANPAIAASFKSQAADQRQLLLQSQAMLTQTNQQLQARRLHKAKTEAELRAVAQKRDEVMWLIRRPVAVMRPQAPNTPGLMPSSRLMANALTGVIKSRLNVGAKEFKVHGTSSEHTRAMELWKTFHSYYTGPLCSVLWWCEVAHITAVSAIRAANTAREAQQAGPADAPATGGGGKAGELLAAASQHLAQMVGGINR